MAVQMFDTNVAKKCGLAPAVILHHFRFWIQKNRANQKHFHDGYYWTYSSIDALAKIFDFLSAKQIRTAVEKLAKSGYIVKGNYNKSAYDKTAWYTITEAGYALFSDFEAAYAETQTGKSIRPNGQIKTPDKADQNVRNGEPIPDSITDIQTDIQTDNTPPISPKGGENADAAFDRFWAAYPLKQGKGAARKAFQKARKKAPLETMLSAIEHQKQSAQWRRDGGQYIPQPATWLNQERWDDELDAGYQNGGKYGGSEHGNPDGGGGFKPSGGFKGW